MGAGQQRKEKIVDYDLRVISLGAGVQSTAMTIMADRGEFGEPPTDAIFADTKAEPPAVYRQLDWLMANIKNIEIHVVTAGDLEADVMQSRDGRTRFASIPLRVQGEGGRDSLLRRQCTREYKIAPIQKKIRELLGIGYRKRAKGKYTVEQMIGISLDEVQRMKDNREEWITNIWPLIFDKPMRRGEILLWYKKEGIPVPEKSACYFCPYHDDKTWLRIKETDPEQWNKAVAFDKAIRVGKLAKVNEAAFLHRSLKPLDEVAFKGDDPNQISLFDNECEGICGV